ncbi:ABC transporter substrate-binding protein [Deltaproteobacteria bacterium TL4]
MANKVKIKIGHLKITDHLILGITQAKLRQGKEKFQYSELETVSFMGWNQITEALEKASIDVAFMLAPTAMDLYSLDPNLRLILFAHKTGSVFIKNKAANIQSVADLKGKVVAIPYQLSVHHMLLHQLLQEHGLEPGTGKDVLIEVMAPSQMPQAIQYDDVGEMAGFIVAEPFGSQAVIEGYGEEFYLSKDLWPHHPCCVVVVRKELIDKNPEAIHELTHSLVKSGDFVHQNESASITIGASFLDQKEEVIRHVLTEPADRILTGEHLPLLEDLEKIQNYMFDKMHLLKHKIDLETFVDTSFAKDAGAK